MVGRARGDSGDLRTTGGRDGRVPRPPSWKVAGEILYAAAAGIEGLNLLISEPRDRDGKRIDRHKRTLGTTADHAAVGDVAVGLIQNHFAFVQTACGNVTQVEQPVGAVGEIGRQRAAVLVGNLVANASRWKAMGRPSARTITAAYSAR